MRLPVDVSGARCYDSAINELTIVANDYYDHFADSLQNDYNQSSGFNKEEVTAGIIKRTIIEAGVPEDKVEDAYDAFKRELVASKYVKVDKSGKIIMQTSEVDFTNIEFNDPVFIEHAEICNRSRVLQYVSKALVNLAKAFCISLQTRQGRVYT